jgi:hypothetical protein
MKLNIGFLVSLSIFASRLIKHLPYLTRKHHRKWARGYRDLMETNVGSQMRVGTSTKNRLRHAKQTAANLAASVVDQTSSSSNNRNKKKGLKKKEFIRDETVKMEDVPLGLAEQLREGIPDNNNSNNPLNDRIQSTKELPVYRVKSSSNSKKNTSSAPKSSSGVRSSQSTSNSRTTSSTSVVASNSTDETPEIKGPREFQLPPRSLSRNGLSSSASKLRPSKQRHDSTGGNNADDEHQQNAMTPASCSDWSHDPKEPFEMNMRLLSSRQRRYRNLLAGGNPEQVARPSMENDSAEQRPPSRQRHAFPTDFADSTAACFADLFSTSSPSAGSPSSVSCGSNEGVSPAPSNLSPSERPPSRYMTGKRSANGMTHRNVGVTPGGSQTTAAEIEESSESSPESDCQGRLPSRRSSQPYWCHSHDPKLDGFEDVDETVPPPFSIEVTNDSPSRAQSTGGLVTSDSSNDLESRCNSRQSSYHEIIEEFDMQRRDLQSRRWSSFSSQDLHKSFGQLPPNALPQEQDSLQRIPSGIIKPK